jgi:hypothetical protein
MLLLLLLLGPVPWTGVWCGRGGGIREGRVCVQLVH